MKKKNQPTSSTSPAAPTRSGARRNRRKSAPKNGTATVEPSPNLRTRERCARQETKQRAPENAAARRKALAVGEPAHERGDRRHVAPRERHAPHGAAGVEQRQAVHGERGRREAKAAAVRRAGRIVGRGERESSRGEQEHRLFAEQENRNPQKNKQMQTNADKSKQKQTKATRRKSNEMSV